MHLLDDDLLPAGSSTSVSHAGAQHRDERTERRNHPRRLDGVLAAIGLVALVERPVARKQVLELLVRLAVRRLRSQLRPDAVALLDLVGVREALAREHAGVGAEAVDLIRQPAPALGVEPGGTRHVGRECIRLRSQLGGVDRGCGIDGLGQLGRPVVGVDEPVDVPPERQPQRQIALDDVRHAVTVFDGLGGVLQPRSPLSTGVKYSGAVTTARPGAERAVLIAVALGALLAPLNSTMIAVALPDIVDDFDTTIGTVGWLVTTYLLALAVVQPVAGKLGDRHGRRGFVLGGLAIFGLASLGAALAPSLAFLIGFRVPAGRFRRCRVPERCRADSRARPGRPPRRRVRDRRRLDRAGCRPRAARRRRARAGRWVARDLPRQRPVRRRRARDRLARGAAAPRYRRGDTVRLARSCAVGDGPDRLGAARDRGRPRAGAARAGDPAPARPRRRPDQVGAAPPRSRLSAALLHDPAVCRSQRRRLARATSRFTPSCSPLRSC